MVCQAIDTTTAQATALAIRKVIDTSIAKIQAGYYPNQMCMRCINDVACPDSFDTNMHVTIGHVRSTELLVRDQVVGP